MDLSSENKTDIKSLQNELERIDGTKKDCTMCKAVLVFSALVLVLVIIFSFYFRVRFDRKNNSSEVLLPPEKSIPLTAEEWNQHVLELGQLIHPELKEATTSAEKLPSPVQPVSSKQNVTNSKISQ